MGPSDDALAAARRPSIMAASRRHMSRGSSDMRNILPTLATAPAALVRSVQMLVARDSWVRSARQRTVGTITGFEEVEKSNYGLRGTTYPHSEYWITYTFNVDGFIFLSGKKIGHHEKGRARRDSLSEGDRIAVYYRHNPRPVEATEQAVRPLSNDSLEAIEALQRASHERGRSAQGTVFAIHPVGALTQESTGKYVDVNLVCYVFADEQGRPWRGTKLVDSVPPVELGAEVKVRYLPEQPEMNTMDD